MKNLVTILVCVFGIVVLTSCTDEAKELNERIKTEKQLHLIDPDDLGETDEEDESIG